MAQCKARFHHHCARRYFDSRNNKTCPNCEIVWDSSNVIGDCDSIDSGSRPRRSNNQTTTKDTRRSQKLEVDNDQMDQDDDDDDDQMENDDE